MAKKYLSIEEAAAELGMEPVELNRLRETGDIRGFADRGNWKFKPEDVETFGRERQTDSDPAVPILDSGIDVAGGDTGLPSSGGSSTILGDGSGIDVAGEAPQSAGSGGSSRIVGDDTGILTDGDDEVGEQATIIRKSGDDALFDAGSDSDVRLVLDDSLSVDSDPDVVVPSELDSDSDVRLVRDPLVGDDTASDIQLVAADSDSDVQLVGADSDSDVKLVGDESQSDVQLVSAGTDKEISTAAPSSDSDVQLIGSDVGSGDDIQLAPSDDAIAFEDAAGSSIKLAADSGIALEGVDDSGIALVSDDDDSGISLATAEDSGISLATAEDSGISLADPTDSGIALEALMGGDDNAAQLDRTQLDVSAISDDDSGYELTDTSGSGTDTGVIVFDDDSDFDDHSQTVVKKGGGDEFDVMEGESFDFDDDGDFGDDLEVSDDVFGEDDELDDMDVFDAGDEDFADSFEGESAAEFITPGAGALQVAVPQQDWGIPTFIGLALTTGLMVFCSIIMFDFVRSMWGYSEVSQPTGITKSLMDTLGGMFTNKK